MGAVVGPNLFGPGQGIAAALGMPPLTGSFVIAVVFQLAAALTYLIGLRPDPYLLAAGRPAVPQSVTAGVSAGRRALFFAVGAVAASHAVMVSVMSMTPVHLLHHGASLSIIGFTLSLHVAGMFALSPVFGLLADRIGRIGTVLIGQAILALALLLVALGSDQTSLVTLGLVLLGLGWSASTVAGSALVSDLATGAHRTRIQGRTDLAMNVTGALGGGLAGPVLAVVGYPGLAVCAGVLVLLTAAGAVAVAGIARNARRLVASGG